MAQLVVAAVLVEGRSKSEVARDYGVSRRWVIALVQRYQAEGEAGLERRSRRPRTINPSRNRERCLGTSVNDVPRHHTVPPVGFEPTLSVV